MKKKILPIILVAVLAVLFAVGASAETYKLGDVNKDGKITTSDARSILRVAAKLDKFADEDQELIADVNGDGSVNVSDARLVLRISAKLDAEIGDIEIGGEETTDLEEEPTTAAEEETTAAEEETTEAEATTTDEDESTTAEESTEEEESTTEEESTDEEDTTDFVIPDGAVGYDDFPVEMQAFISGSFGFTGSITSEGEEQSVTLKMDGTNMKMTTVMNMDEYGDMNISILMLSSTNILGRETTTMYMLSEDTGYYMDMSSIMTLMGMSDEDLGLDSIDGLSIELDDTSSLIAYVSEVTVDDTTYTVYTVESDEAKIEFYYADDEIKQILSYNVEDGTVDATFNIDEFYSELDEGDLSLSSYRQTNSIFTLFGMSLF